MESDPLLERFKATMVLAGVGDAMGYRNSFWEFTRLGRKIHDEMEILGGIENISLCGWMISDDQVMHIHTARALILANSFDEIIPKLKEEYILSSRDFDGRSPGEMTLGSIRELKENNPIVFEKKAGGCGGAMRAMCIGLCFFGENEREKLISVSLESCKLTHNNPTAMLGALTSALFTAYAIEGVPISSWGYLLINKILPKAYEYMKKSKDWENYQPHLFYFEEKIREIDSEDSKGPIFPENFGVTERDNFYSSFSYSGWAGSSGHDSVLVAYDALLGSGSSWEEYVLRGVLHGGDSDSTGCIGAAWRGALYGMKGVPKINYQYLEYLEIAEELGEKLYALSKGEKVNKEFKNTKEEFFTLSEHKKDFFNSSIIRIEDRVKILKEEIGEINSTQDREKLKKMEILAKYAAMSFSTLFTISEWVTKCKGDEPEKKQLLERISQSTNSMNELRSQLSELGVRETTY